MVSFAKSLCIWGPREKSTKGFHGLKVVICLGSLLTIKANHQRDSEKFGDLHTVILRQLFNPPKEPFKEHFLINAHHIRCIFIWG